MPVLGWGQSTTVTLNVSDAGGQTWNNGSYAFTFVGPQSVSWSGGTFNPNNSITGSLNGSGSATVSVPDNNAMSATGTSWTITACAAVFPTQCSSTTVVITGAAQTVTMTPPAISISVPTTPSRPLPIRAYADSEISGGWIGFTYYNLVSSGNRVCTAVTSNACSSWASASGVSTATGVVALFTGCSGVLVLRADGTCGAAGTGNVSTTAGAAFGAFLYDFSLSTIELPEAAGFTPNADSNIGYDLTANNWLLWGNGVANVNVVVPFSVTVADEHCVDWSVVGTVITVDDAGAQGTANCNPVSSVAGRTGVVTLTSTDVGLSAVTNDVQTKAAIVPNTAPSAGQVPCGNAGGTAYVPCTVSGDSTVTSAGAMTNTGLNGTSLAGLATGLLKNTTGTGVPSVVAAPTGAVLGTTDTQVVTNKDLTSGTNTYPTFNQNTTGTASNLSGTPALPNGTTATTQSASDNSTKLATTAYADTGLALKAPLASPTFTGSVTAPAGTAGAAAYRFTGDTAGAGLYNPSAALYGFTGATNEFLRLGAGIVRGISSTVFGTTSSSTSSTGAFDWGISRNGAAAAVACGNGTAANAACTLASKRYTVDGATTLVAGDFTLGAGWGNTASIAITDTTSKDSAAIVTITTAGTGIVANPTLQLTFKDGTWTNTPACNAIQSGGNDIFGDSTTTARSATAQTWQWNATPTTAKTYEVTITCTGT